MRRAVRSREREFFCLCFCAHQNARKNIAFSRAALATLSSPSFPHRAVVMQKPDPRSRVFVGVLREEGVRGRMRANRQRPTIYFHPSGCRPRHGPGLITSCKWPFPRKTRRAGSEERVFLFMFWCASEGAPKHSLFQSRTGDAGCLLSTCCCLLPLNFHPSECRPPHSLLS